MLQISKLLKTTSNEHANTMWKKIKKWNGVPYNTNINQIMGRPLPFYSKWCAKKYKVQLIGFLKFYLNLNKVFVNHYEYIYKLYLICYKIYLEYILKCHYFIANYLKCFLKYQIWHIIVVFMVNLSLQWRDHWHVLKNEHYH